ncbi:hypothetical protein [Streptomyces griseoluteus]
MGSQKIGHTLDNLGVEVDLDDGDMPTDAVVLIKVVKEDGSVSMTKGRSEALDWISALGMLTAAQAIENSGYQLAEDD